MTISKQQFTKLYNDHLEPIYRFCYLKVGSKSDAEDLSQEVFLKLLEYLKEKHQEQKIENMRAFIYQIARNLIVDHYREKGRAPLPLEEEIKEITPSKEEPEKLPILSSDMRDISRALMKINQDYADLVIWHYIDDLSIPEIAKIMGEKEGNVRVKLHRGLQALKNEMNTKE